MSCIPAIRHVSEDAVVRAGNPAQQVEDGQANRREHPVQHAEEQHRGSGGHARTSSLRRNLPIRRNSPTSIRRRAAYTTIAPSAAVGKAARTPRPTNSVIRTAPRATSE